MQHDGFSKRLIGEWLITSTTVSARKVTHFDIRQLRLIRRNQPLRPRKNDHQSNIFVELCRLIIGALLFTTKMAHFVITKPYQIIQILNFCVIHRLRWFLICKSQNFPASRPALYSQSGLFKRSWCVHGVMQNIKRSCL